MRFTRLRRDIEDGNLIGTHGTLFQGAAERIAESQKKRKRPMQERREGEALHSRRLYRRKSTLIPRSLISGDETSPPAKRSSSSGGGDEDEPEVVIAQGRRASRSAEARSLHISRAGHKVQDEQPHEAVE